MKHLSFPILSLMLLLSACAKNYVLTDVSGSRILIDSKFDAREDKHVTNFMKPYKQRVDSVSNPVVGQSARRMTRDRPESELSNLISDIMVWGANELLNQQTDFGVYNMGGLRASLPEGKVTYGDVVEIVPFENKLCVLTLSGEKVLQLFGEMAHRGGECVSHGVELVITRDGKLKNALIHGKPVDISKNYRIATVDYVAQGNDGMNAFKSKTNYIAPQEFELNSRFVVMAYFRKLAAQGKIVDAKLEKRIKIE